MPCNTPVRKFVGEESPWQTCETTLSERANSRWSDQTPGAAATANANVRGDAPGLRKINSRWIAQNLVQRNTANKFDKISALCHTLLDLPTMNCRPSGRNDQVTRRHAWPTC
eukprot:1550978-Alexandrium_andersonii.AAC.1